MPLLDWLFGPDITVNRHGTRVLVPVTTSVENLNALRDYLRMEVGQVEIFTNDRISMRTGIHGDKEVGKILEEVDEALRFQLMFVAGPATDEPRITDQHVIVQLYTHGPTAVQGRREDLFEGIAGRLRRDARRRLSTSRLVVAAKLVALISLSALILAGWFIAPFGDWPRSTLLTIVAIVAGLWILDKIDQPANHGDAALYGFRRDRTIVLDRTRREIVEDHITRKREVTLTVSGIVVGAILAVIGSYLSFHS